MLKLAVISLMSSFVHVQAKSNIDDAFKGQVYIRGLQIPKVDDLITFDYCESNSCRRGSILWSALMDFEHDPLAKYHNWNFTVEAWWCFMSISSKLQAFCHSVSVPQTKRTSVTKWRNPIPAPCSIACIGLLCVWNIAFNLS